VRTRRPRRKSPQLGARFTSITWRRARSPNSSRPAKHGSRRSRKPGSAIERGWFIEAGSDTFYTLHAFDDFTALDRLREARKVAPSKLVEARTAYDRDSDGALLPPHRSEIWVREVELDYRPSTGGLDEKRFGAGRMIIEEVHPGPGGEAYGAAWKELVAALGRAQYPLTFVSFSSSYGSGEQIGLWLAKTKADLDASPSVQDAAAGVLGKENADALFQRLAKCVVAHEEVSIVRRADLDSP
jgi:hypothetical protein